MRGAGGVHATEKRRSLCARTCDPRPTTKRPPVEPARSQPTCATPIGVRAKALAILPAALFGASTPFAKLLLGGGVDPWLLAGLLYLGSGIGLGIVAVARRIAGRVPAETPLRRGYLPWLALVVISGGVVGPVLL